jgi:hypothetical protein
MTQANALFWVRLKCRSTIAHPLLASPLRMVVAAPTTTAAETVALLRASRMLGEDLFDALEWSVLDVEPYTTPEVSP